MTKEIDLVYGVLVTVRSVLLYLVPSSTFIAVLTLLANIIANFMSRKSNIRALRLSNRMVCSFSMVRLAYSWENVE